jgi:methionyl aminopeptidase
MPRRREPGIEIKSPAQLAAMAEAGQAVAAALHAVGAAAAPGVSTAELDAIAAAEISAAGAVPSFPGYHGFPATMCTSVNDEIVPGIPSPSVTLKDGDVVSVDCGAHAGGWHADAALTLGVGCISGEAAHLMGTCEQALWHGLAAARAGSRLGDISHAVQSWAEAAGGCAIVDGYAGHAIGSQMHMTPPVPNRGSPGQGQVLAEGMAFAVEPVLAMGTRDTRLLADGWTVVSDDGGWSAHFGHTVAITADGPWVLTAFPEPVIAPAPELLAGLVGSNR